MLKKLVVGIFACLMLISGAFFITQSYEKAETVAANQSTEFSLYEVAFEVENNVSLRTLPYALKAEVNSQHDAFELLLEAQCEDPVILQRIKGVFGVYYGYWKSHIYEYNNIHSAVKDLVTGQAAGTHQDLLNQSMDELTDTYQIMLKLNYDEFGLLSMETYDQVNYSWSDQFDDSMKTTIEQYMKAEIREVLSEVDEDKWDISLKPITNMEMIIAVPSELQYGDVIYAAGQPSLRYHFIEMMTVVVLVVSAVLFVLSLFLPFSVIKNIKWIQTLLDIKFEILAALLASALVAGAVLLLNIASSSVDGSLIQFLQRYEIYITEMDLVAVINTGLWLIYLSLVMFSAWVVRWVFHKGFTVYAKENTCIAWIIGMIGGLFRWMIGLFDKIMSFDLKDNTNQFVIKVVGINLIAMILFCCLFPVGIFFALLYSVAVFIYLKKRLGRIQSDYANVLYTTMMLSDGNFDVSVHEDAGMFNSLKRSLGTLKTGFQKAVNEEVKSQRMKSELITNVSHDLKTPLTSMITYVDLLKNCEDEQQRQQYIETLERNSERLKRLIEDLFEVSKVQSGNVALNLVEVDLVSLIHQVKFECEERLLEKNLEVRIAAPEDRLMLQLDSAKAYRIFENLILNICKYALPSTRVFIDIFKDEKMTCVIFKNISEAEIDFDPKEITERFVQGDKSRNAQGSGLGLAIVKSFTELHHGQFRIETDGDLFKAIVEFPNR